MNKLRQFFSFFSMIALGIEGLVLFILNFVNQQLFSKVFATLSGLMLLEIVIFLIVFSIDTEKFQNELPTELEKKFDNLDKTIKLVNNASIEILGTQNEFYEKLKKARINSSTKVDLTQLDPWPPADYEKQGERQNYFDADLEFARAHQNIIIRRIVSIPNLKKLEWIRNLIENSKDLNNLFLAFVNIPTIEKDSPFPKMLSLQIIDRNEVFILNPRYSYMPRQYHPCVYLKNKDVALIYDSYYESIWQKLTTSNDISIGCILKDGTDIEGYKEKLEQIQELISPTSVK